MEMDLDFVTSSMLRQETLSTHLGPVLDDRTERSKTFLKFGSPKLPEAGHILGIICIHLQTK